MGQKQFNPNPKAMPLAFKTTKKNGKQVFRIWLNVDEVLARLEENKKKIALDIPLNKAGQIQLVTGNGKGGQWTALPFYAWAMEDKPQEQEATTNGQK